MALIKCKECGKEFSDEQKQCIHCGSTKHRSFVKKHPILSFFGFMFVLSSVLPVIRGGEHTTTANATTQTTNNKEIQPKKNDGSDISKAIENVELDYKWSKGGFGSVMVMDSLTIKNNNPYPVKDLTISCKLTAESGTSIGSPQKKLLRRVEPNKKIVERDFSIGFINSQAANAGCYISDLVPEANWLTL